MCDHRFLRPTQRYLPLGSANKSRSMSMLNSLFSSAVLQHVKATSAWEWQGLINSACPTSSFRFTTSHRVRSFKMVVASCYAKSLHKPSIGSRSATKHNIPIIPPEMSASHMKRGRTRPCGMLIMAVRTISEAMANGMEEYR